MAGVRSMFSRVGDEVREVREARAPVPCGHCGTLDFSQCQEVVVREF